MLRVIGRLCLRRAFSNVAPWKQGPLPKGQTGRTLRRLLAAGQGMVLTEQKELVEDPLLASLLQGLASEGWRVGEHPGQPFVSFSRDSPPYRLQVFLSYPRDGWEDWLEHYGSEQKKAYLATLGEKGIDVTLAGATLNAMDKMLLHDQLAFDQKESTRQLLRREDAPTVDFYALLSKGEGALGLKGLSLETQLVYEQLYLLPETLTPPEVDALARREYLGPGYHNLNSNMKKAVHELFATAGLSAGLFPRLQYVAERAESSQFLRWTQTLTLALFNSHPDT